MNSLLCLLACKNELSFNNSVINNFWVKTQCWKITIRKPEWNALYFWWVFLLVFVCMHVGLFVGSTLLSSSFRRECVSVCVLLHSPQGLFQLRAKNTEKLGKSFYVLLSEMILRKAFYKNTFYSDFYIQKGTYSITKLPSSFSASINPSSILRSATVLCVEALLWAKSMSLVVEQCRACQWVYS